ncbi:lipid II:glycine glycyltransferase FemX [Spirosoma aerolatum]|uniref:lipid II:glycine glycyltransferase FemX n=1 Tax=Spirosoma aerolatum TaxID=1211326 RepID=UPI0009AE72E6|nr:GNAT family N-acetyltransferase [Spirosoma aerolatum]
MYKTVQHNYTLITTLDLDIEQQISSFLGQCKGFHYFQSPAYFRVATASKKLKPFYIIARDREQIAGIILLVQQVQSTLPVLSFLSSRTIIWGGPVVTGQDLPVVEGLLQFFQKHRPSTIYTQVRNLSDTTVYQSLFARFGFQYEEHLDILVDLGRSEEELWKDVVTKRRNQIRRAIKEGCVFERHTSLDSLRTCYTILQEVYQRAKLPLPDFSHFESLLQESDEKSGLRLFTVVWEGQLIGCMLCLVHGRWVYDYYAGAFSAYYKKYPNDLMPWAVFQWAKQQGFQYFDFGGAGKPGVPYGVRDYKKQFGGQLVCYGRYEKVHYPRLFGLLKLGYQIWQKR